MKYAVFFVYFVLVTCAALDCERPQTGKRVVEPGTALADSVLQDSNFWTSMDPYDEKNSYVTRKIPNGVPLFDAEKLLEKKCLTFELIAGGESKGEIRSGSTYNEFSTALQVGVGGAIGGSYAGATAEASVSAATSNEVRESDSIAFAYSTVQVKLGTFSLGNCGSAELKDALRSEIRDDLVSTFRKLLQNSSLMAPKIVNGEVGLTTENPFRSLLLLINKNGLLYPRESHVLVQYQDYSYMSSKNSSQATANSVATDLKASYAGVSASANASITQEISRKHSNWSQRQVTNKFHPGGLENIQPGCIIDCGIANQELKPMLSCFLKCVHKDGGMCARDYVANSWSGWTDLVPIYREVLGDVPELDTDAVDYIFQLINEHYKDFRHGKGFVYTKDTFAPFAKKTYGPSKIGAAPSPHSYGPWQWCTSNTISPLALRLIDYPMRRADKDWMAFIEAAKVPICSDMSLDEYKMIRTDAYYSGYATTVDGVPQYALYLFPEILFQPNGNTQNKDGVRRGLSCQYLVQHPSNPHCWLKANGLDGWIENWGWDQYIGGSVDSRIWGIPMGRSWEKECGKVRAAYNGDVGAGTPGGNNGCQMNRLTVRGTKVEGELMCRAGWSEESIFRSRTVCRKDGGKSGIWLKHK